MAADALTMKVREGGRVVKIAVMVATGVNADGYREILGVATSTAESGAGWNTFFKDLVARGLNGVALVTSDAHTGLVDAIGANLPGASWQRCRTHYTVNLMAVCPKHAWGGVKAMLHCVFDQIDADGRARPVRQAAGPRPVACPRSTTTSTPPATRSWPSPRSRTASGARSGPTTPTSASTARSAAAPTSSGSSPTGPRSSASSARSWPSRHDEWADGRRYLGLEVLAKSRLALITTETDPGGHQPPARSAPNPDNDESPSYTTPRDLTFRRSSSSASERVSRPRLAAGGCRGWKAQRRGEVRPSLAASPVVEQRAPASECRDHASWLRVCRG